MSLKIKIEEDFKNALRNREELTLFCFAASQGRYFEQGERKEI